ncbi:MAG TPA: alpha-amylase family glycosyl hydrolase [Pyrinomonadaceae bacterium]|jgi:glycosidase|nr:alpha-amylase family glycosyl hydrolase [Pyrinomonadaceae bacterium]
MAQPSSAHRTAKPSTVSQLGLPSVIKVEPPSWWAAHTLNPVRLLVRGKNLRGARVQATRPATKTSEVLVNREGTYLFVNVRISPAARPGSYPLTLVTAQGSTTIPFKIEAPLAAATHFQGVTADDVIYLIMPDRFADGDPANNVPAGAPAAATDRKNARAYHGGDLRGVINHLPYLKDLGVTALWLTPWYDNWNGVNTCDKAWCPNTYYHGYHAVDYYAVEDHFGDMTTLRELIERAHRQGLKIIQDQVANHVGSQHPWVKDPPLDNWFHGTLAQHSRNQFRNSVLLSPHANSDEFRNTLDGWFSDDLPDMNQEEPEVARYEIQNSLWWIGVTGLDAIRQDTIQYMPRAFIRDLSNALHRQYPKMWMVGEVFERDTAQTAFFIGGHSGWDGIDTKLDSVFDFPVWNASLSAFTNKAPLRVLRDQLKYDALYPAPLKLTTLANNHDTARFMSLEGATLEGAMMHVAFTLSVRGTPQLYYGEEIAMEGKDDPDNRRDFPGGFPGDVRNAFEAGGRKPKEQEMYEWTRSWIRLRAEHSALRQGRLIDLFYDDDAYVFARQDKNETVIVAFNRDQKARKLTIPASAIGLHSVTELASLIGASARVGVVNGIATLTLPKSSVSAFVVR